MNTTLRSTPPLPEQQLGSGVKAFVDQYLEQHKELFEASETRLLHRIIERLGQSDPEIQRLVENASQVRRVAAEKFVQQPTIPPRLRQRGDLHGFNPPDQLSQQELLERVLPRLRMIRIPYNLKSMASRSLDDAIQQWIAACTEMSQRAAEDPRWADALISDPPDSGSFTGWSFKPTSARCLAWCIGQGHSQPNQVTNTARWDWWFSPDVSEDLEFWLTGRLSGPCVWRQDSGDVTIWVFTEARAFKWTPSTSEQPGFWDQAGYIPYNLRLSYSTNDMLGDNGRPPARFESGGKPYVEFTPTDDHFRISAEPGLYVVRMDVTISLIADNHGVIVVGSSGGDNLDLCDLTTYCNICRCT